MSMALPMLTMTMSVPHSPAMHSWPAILAPAPSLPPLSLSLFAPQRKTISRSSSSNTNIFSNSSVASLRPSDTSDVSEIIDRLYVSDIYTAESEQALSALGITHVLSVMRGTVVLPAPTPSSPISHLQLPIDDLPFAELAVHLPETCSFISSALSASPNNRVLVHCAQGVSRSVSVVCAYLMMQRGWDVRTAVAYVKRHRWVADPNPGFLAQLREWEDVLGAGGMSCE